MKKYKSIGKLLAVSFLTAAIASACTEDAMDKINENPNNPLDAPMAYKEPIMAPMEVPAM